MYFSEKGASLMDLYPMHDKIPILRHFCFAGNTWIQNRIK